jgi:uncharacterized protein (DUF2249 family)
MPEQELDVRTIRKPDRHPLIFQTFDELPVDGSFVLVNNHDPKHLHDEFDADYPLGYAWDYLDEGPDLWRIRIRKLASTSLPRVLGDTVALGTGDRDSAGAVWKLQMRRRDLDANVVQVPPGAAIDEHVGPDLDVLLVVLAGDGELATERSTIDLRAGGLVWLPRRSRRGFLAGPTGLQYLTVHQRRQSLVISTAAGRG